jgi:glucose-6-phosphate isomerase, archaeal
MAAKIDAATGIIAARTGAKETLIAELAGCFAGTEASATLAANRGDEVAYFVHEMRPDASEPYGLVSGTSTLKPGKVGREFFMTRGHIHSRPDRPEIYFCLRGRGVMHLETLTGETSPLAMESGSLTYVPPFMIHRSINVGDEPLITLFCYPADAGQDYEIIVRAGGMRTLIVDDGAGGWIEVANPRYQPRSIDEQQRYLRG